MNKLSIITATYNAAETIRDCLKCVRGQSVGVEHILIDGKSEDTTLDIVEEYRGDLATVISEPDKGIYDAMNKGLRLVSGDIIGILNADDFYPDKDTLAQVIKVFDDPQIGACYGDLLYVCRKTEDRGQRTASQAEAEGYRVRADDFKVVRYWKSDAYDPQKFYWGWMPPHPTFFVRRTLYEKYGLFNLELGSAADYEIMLRFLVRHGVKAAYIPEVLVKMRTGGVSNASVHNRLAANRMDRKAWEVNGLKPYPWTLWAKPIRKIGQWFTKPKV